jgi:hypothetical protein
MRDDTVPVGRQKYNLHSDRIAEPRHDILLGMVNPVEKHEMPLSDQIIGLLDDNRHHGVLPPSIVHNQDAVCPRERIRGSTVADIDEQQCSTSIRKSSMTVRHPLPVYIRMPSRPLDTLAFN